jgi:Zn-dependent peptidase ImmA (M78 family)
MIARIGEVVARVRVRRGLATAELAARIERDVDIIERLEAGQPGVTTTQLDAIAAALGIDSGALRRGEEIERPVPSVFLLHHQEMQDFRDEDLAILDDAIEQARDLCALGRVLRELDATWPGATFKRSAAPHDASDAAARHGYQLATELRRRLQRATEPLRDLRAVAEEELAVVVLRRRLSTRGACAVKAGDAAAIVLNGSAHQFDARTRAAIAHELCHVLHDPDREGVHVVLDLETDRNAHANEQRARGFAAELLLPRAGLNGLFGVPRDVREQAAAVEMVTGAMDHFGASWQITANHLCNHGFVDRSLRAWLEALEAHALAPSWSVVLPPLDGPSVLVRTRAQRAHEQALITDGEARAMLGLEPIDPLPWTSPA